MSMTPPIPCPATTLDRWKQIEQIFHQAREAGAGARGELLERLCAGDDRLLGDVRALLAADQEANRPRPPKEMWKADLAGRRAGNYQLDSLLGTGGMGSVYLAHRCDGQFDRVVALKILGANLRGEFFSERFAIERQLLAGLDHPNITRLLDSGVSADGDPYLVLEYVDGNPIDLYCDRHRLGVEDRIRLFLQVCAAVEFAHGKSVIHRDLKPSNILVSVSGPDKPGLAKLLDFGTAKLFEPIAESNATATRFRMMTPQFASPEQLRGDPLTPQTDVYSLGIILYELLIGAWPFGNPQSVVAGLERAVRDVEPKSPKAAIDDRIAALRGSSKAALVRTVCGDLWDVILQAIDPNPRQRYLSAASFAADLERFLGGTRVLARRQNLAWRAAKAVRRNRAAAAWALAAITIVAAAILVSGQAKPAPPSIAVLPFAGGEYLASGLTAEITESLNRRPAIEVIAQPSSKQAAAEFKGQPVDFVRLGKRLNVANVLTGSVEQTGGGMKVIASLISTSDGSRIWTNTYRRPIGDLGLIESDVERTVAFSLGLAQAPPTKPAPNEEAHLLYLKARIAETHGAAGIAQADEYCRRAVELDPTYGDAWTCLGREAWNKNTVNPNSADIKSALEYTLKALQIDPNDARAHYQLGLNAMYFDWDWKRAEREFQLAAAGRFDGGDMSLALLYTITGRQREAGEHLRRARDLDPVGGAAIINTAELLAIEGRYDEASEQYRIIAERVPNVVRWQILIAMCDGLRGKKEEAVRRLRAISNTAGESGRQVQRELAYWSGNWEEARRILDEDARDNELAMHNGALNGLSMTSLAEAYAALGDMPNALRWLNLAVDSHDGDAIYLRVAWQFANFQNTPEFHRLKKRLNLDW